MSTLLPALLEQSQDKLLAFLTEAGLPAFRAKQIYASLFERGVNTFEEMAELPQALRSRLTAQFQLHPLQHAHHTASKLDGTIRYFFKTQDGKEVSTVFLPDADRLSLCLSTQVGCAYRCTFCASGLVPFQRQLSAAEIVDQILLIRRHSGRMPTNLLFMGMGEPLANFTEVVKAIRWICERPGLGMSPSRITLSTSGLVPQIVKLAEEGVKVHLAISLHAVEQKKRKEIMPVSGRFMLKELIQAANTYALKTNSWVTFEYILLAGVNDQEKDARELTKLMRKVPHKVNLIPYNPVPGLPYQRPEPQQVLQFQAWLREWGTQAFIRKPKGLDIGSACGQLGSAERV